MAVITFTHPLAVDFLGLLRPDDRILDYGCGYGRSLGELAARGFTNTVSIDFSSRVESASTQLTCVT